MGIEQLYRSATEWIAFILEECGTIEETRQTFGLKDDFTTAQKEQLRRENSWVDDEISEDRAAKGSESGGKEEIVIAKGCCKNGWSICVTDNPEKVLHVRSQREVFPSKKTPRNVNDDSAHLQANPSTYAHFKVESVANKGNPKPILLSDASGTLVVFTTAFRKAFPKSAVSKLKEYETARKMHQARDGDEVSNCQQDGCEGSAKDLISLPNDILHTICDHVSPGSTC